MSAETQQEMAIIQIREAIEAAAGLPAGREKALVLTHLETALLWAKAAMVGGAAKV